MVKRDPINELPLATQLLVEQLLEGDDAPDRDAVINTLRSLVSPDPHGTDPAGEAATLDASIAAAKASIAEGRCRPAEDVLDRLRAQLGRGPRGVR